MGADSFGKIEARFRRMTEPEWRPLNCVFFSLRNDWFRPFLVACPGLRFCSLPGLDKEIPRGNEQDGRPPVDRPDVIIITPDWYSLLETQGSGFVAKAFAYFRSISRAVVGVDNHDAFRLWTSPEALERLDLLIKPQGLYRDRDLYNFDVGPIFSGNDWTSKRISSKRFYSEKQLDKLRLSLPCFFSNHRAVRHVTRQTVLGMGTFQAGLRLAGDVVNGAMTSVLSRFVPRRSGIHCIVSLTHMSRLDLVHSLRKAGITADIGVVILGPTIGGTVPPGGDHTTEPPDVEGFFGIRNSEAQQNEIVRALSSAGLLRRPISRFQFYFTILSSDAVIAPTGFGEITTRHADAWANGRALICPDLSHAETMFPFRDGYNSIYCKPDFSNIGSVIHDVEAGRVDHRAIARQGHEDWLRWTSDIPGLLERGLLAHLREACGKGRELK